MQHYMAELDGLACRLVTNVKTRESTPTKAAVGGSGKPGRYSVPTSDQDAGPAVPRRPPSTAPRDDMLDYVNEDAIDADRRFA